jgi:hypothetical protein
MQQPNLTDRSVIVSASKPIKWNIPDSMRTEHATNLVVQQRGSEFTFLFFEVEPPLFSGTPEEQARAYQDMQEIPGKCIAKIVMSAENTTEAANSLIESINRFNTMVLQAMKGQENAGTLTNREQSPTS